jgi:hypothetical protein
LEIYATGIRGIEETAVSQGRTIRTTFWLGSYLSRLTPQTYIGASAEGAEMMTFLAPPFK